jgi:hypothetical protein
MRRISKVTICTVWVAVCPIRHTPSEEVETGGGSQADGIEPFHGAGVDVVHQHVFGVGDVTRDGVN